MATTRRGAPVPAAGGGHWPIRGGRAAALSPGGHYLRAAGPTPREDRSRAAGGPYLITASLVAPVGVIAASRPLAATREDVAQEAGQRAGQGRALQDEGDVEAHRATLRQPALPAPTVTALRLLPATSP